MASLFSIVQNQVPPPNIPSPMPQAQYAQPQPQTAQIPQAVLQQIQTQQTAPPVPQAAAPGFETGGYYNIPGFEGGTQYDDQGYPIGGGGGTGPIGAGDQGFSYFQQATAPTYVNGQTGQVDLPAQLAFWNQLSPERKAQFANLEVGLKARGVGSSGGDGDQHDYTFDYAQLAQQAAENQLNRDIQLAMSNNEITGRSDIANLQNRFNEADLTVRRDTAVQDSIDKQRQIAENAAAQAQNFFSANVGYAEAGAFDNYNPITGATPEERTAHPATTKINPSFIMGVGGSSAAGPNIPAPVFTR